RDVGHRVPTGFPDRHLLFVLEARDAADQVMPLELGAQLPSSVGVKLAGQPGTVFAKRFIDAEGGIPAPFWRTGVKIDDNRLMPERCETATFRFPDATASVHFRLLYRPTWKDATDVVIVDELHRLP